MDNKPDFEEAAGESPPPPSEQQREDVEKDMQKRDEIINREKLHLLSIFPEDIWCLIAKVNTETAEKLIALSPHFKNLFWRFQRTVTLFPKVLDVLVNKYCWTDFCNVGSHRCANIPCYMSWMRSEIFKVRSVCKYWNAAYDNSFRLSLHDTAQDYQRDTGSMMQIVGCAFDELNASSRRDGNFVEDFLQHFESSHGNGETSRSPFVGNSVRVTYVGSDQKECDRVFFDKFAVVISKYGHHIYDLSLIEKVKIFYLPGFIKFRTILLATPYLEFLDIEHQVFSQNEIFHPVPRVKKNQSIDPLTEYMNLNPLPTLKRLKSIKIAGNGSVSSILYELIRKNNHISKLTISEISIAEHNVLTTPLPNLRELSLQLYSEKDLNAFEDPRLNWPLTKLAVHFGKFDSFNWSQLLSVLQNKCWETLSELSLSIPIFEPSERASLYLKHIKRLELKFRCYSSLDFILPLKDTLEYLSVIDPLGNEAFENMKQLGEAIEEGQTVKFWSCIEEPTKSNIWMHFPKLDCARFFRSRYENCMCSGGHWLVCRDNINK